MQATRCRMVWAGAIVVAGLGAAAASSGAPRTPVRGETVCPSWIEPDFGVLIDGGIEDLCESDDRRALFLAQAQFSPLLPYIRVRIGGVSQGENPVDVTLHVEHSCTVIPPAGVMRIEVPGGVGWITVFVGESGRVDQLVDIDLPEPTLVTRVSWFVADEVVSPFWLGRLDQLRWTVTP